MDLGLISKIAGAGMQAGGLIAGIAGGLQTKHRLNKMQKNNPAYTAYDSPELADRLSLAKTLLNARMPGMARAQQNIQGNQANVAAGVERNATSGAQALQMLSASQAQTNDAFGELQTKDEQNYYNNLNNLTGAQMATATAKTAENDKVYNDKVRRYQDAINIQMAKNGITQQGAQSLINGGGEVSSLFDSKYGQEISANTAAKIAARAAMKAAKRAAQDNGG
jgi:hypothetical protein